MLIKRAVLREIEAGRISVQFRRWKRPTVKAGGTLLTAVGQLAIRAVEPVDLEQLGEADAIEAGFDGLASLRESLAGRSGQVYRVRVAYAGADPRVALRQEEPEASELRALLDSLDRRDARSSTGPWTRQVLALIEQRPSTRAAELAAAAGIEKRRFKSLVRGLKSLGLTVSEEVGYRLSPRGEAVLRAVRDKQPEDAT